VKELCLQLGRLFCIKMLWRLQQSFQQLTADTIPYSVMSSGIRENNNNNNKRGDVHAFI